MHRNYIQQKTKTDFLQLHFNRNNFVTFHKWSFVQCIGFILIKSRVLNLCTEGISMIYLNIIYRYNTFKKSFEKFANNLIWPLWAIERRTVWNFMMKWYAKWKWNIHNWQYSTLVVFYQISRKISEYYQGLKKDCHISFRNKKLHRNTKMNQWGDCISLPVGCFICMYMLFHYSCLTRKYRLNTMIYMYYVSSLSLSKQRQICYTLDAEFT